MRRLQHGALDPRAIQAELAEPFPDLRVTGEKQGVRVRGSFPVLFEGEVLDRFAIDVEIDNRFPQSVPKVRETAGRIPLSPGRHANRSDGTLCPIVPLDWLVRPERDRSVLSFLQGPVHNYLLGQSLVERGDPWPFGERAHGRAGVLEALRDLLAIETEREILVYLNYLSHEEVKGHWACPCGSGSRLRNCHVSRVRQLQQIIPPEIARQALALLRHTSS